MSSSSSDLARELPRSISVKESRLLFLLAAVQFTFVLDFVLMMPLGPTFIEVFQIQPSQFGLMISAYNFSAAIFGFVGALFIDRFDRKKVLLVLYFGFIAGTLFCGFASNHFYFIIARGVAGGFAGLMGGTIFAIIGDKIPEERRGKATGVVMSAFSVASVVGVPFGLFLADHFSWRAPFFFLSALSVVILFLAMLWLPSVREHLSKLGATGHHPWKAIREVVFDKNHLNAFALTIVLMYAGFSIIPYVSTSLVFNAGVPRTSLFMVYLVGGIFTFFAAQYVGRLSDQFGKLPVFRVSSLISIAPMIIITALPRTSLFVAVACTTFFMVFNSARNVPALAMVTAAVNQKRRGSFMSINSSLQQLFSGIGSYLSGLIIYQNPATKELVRFPIVGIISAFIILIAIYLGGRVRRIS